MGILGVAIVSWEYYSVLEVAMDILVGASIGASIGASQRVS